MAAIRTSGYFDQQGRPYRRRLYTVGELEELYGRNATVELDLPPQSGYEPYQGANDAYQPPYAQAPYAQAPYAQAPYAQAPYEPAPYEPYQGGYEEYDEEMPEGVPRKRLSGWLPIVMLVLLGAGGLLGYGLYKGGHLRSVPLVVNAVEGVTLGPTDEPTVDRNWEPPPVLPLLGAEEPRPAAAPGISVPIEEALAAPETETPPPVLPRGANNRPQQRATPAEADPRAIPSEPVQEAVDEAATREAIQRDLEKLRPEPVEQEPAPRSEPYPPGYIEAPAP